MDQIDLQLKMEMTPIDASVIARMGTLTQAVMLWLAFRRGYELRPRLTEVEKQLVIERREKQRVEDENKLLRSMLIGRAS